MKKNNFSKIKDPVIVWRNRATFMGAMPVFLLSLCLIGIVHSILGVLLGILIVGASESISTPYVPGQFVSFEDGGIDLGQRTDGYYYKIVHMVDTEPGRTGHIDIDYVVLKKMGETPKVSPFRYFPESGQLNPYLVSNNLSTDDFSDMIKNDMIEQNPEYFEDRKDMFFSVIDMDTDILKTPDDYDYEEFVWKSKVVLLGLVAYSIWFISALKILISVTEGISSIIALFMYFIFSDIYKSYTPKEKKVN